MCIRDSCAAVAVAIMLTCASGGASPCSGRNVPIALSRTFPYIVHAARALSLVAPRLGHPRKQSSLVRKRMNFVKSKCPFHASAYGQVHDTYIRPAHAIANKRRSTTQQEAT
eukprot:817505-Pleurochrysis_carterae.AAC.1